jgi:adenylosuccinate synthase
MPEQKAPAAAPSAPLPTAENLKINERLTSKDGRYGENTARSRRTLRTDVKASGGSGTNIPRMG